jgi:hypothetical protein
MPAMCIVIEGGCRIEIAAGKCEPSNFLLPACTFHLSSLAVTFVLHTCSDKAIIWLQYPVLLAHAILFACLRCCLPEMNM